MAGDIQRYRDNLRDELNGAALYAALAAAEADPLRKDLFPQLSQAEAHHAGVWREKLAAAGVHDEAFVPDLRTRLLARLARHFGPRFVLPTIAAAEFADRNKYAAQSDAQEISAQERGHAAVIQAVAARVGGADRPAGSDIARAEPWHRGVGTGNNLRAAVLGLGANDGLVSNFCLVMGVPGAGANNSNREAQELEQTSAAVLYVVGALTSLFNGRGVWFSALRQLAFGCLAAAVTYGLGAALETSLS
jgi:hypothetical protein